MNTILLLLLIIGHVSETPLIEDRVDKIVISHHYAISEDDKGKIFTYEVASIIVFYDWEYGRFNVRAWRLIRVDKPFDITRNWEHGGYYTIFNEFGSDDTRKVCSRLFEEKWIEYDLEQIEQSYFPKKFRRPLTPINKP